MLKTRTIVHNLKDQNKFYVHKRKIQVKDVFSDFIDEKSMQ